MNRRLVASIWLRAVCIWFLWPVALCNAQTERVAQEDQVKAAYLYKFLGLVDWPPSAFEGQQTPFVIGVSGAEGLADELTTMVANRSTNGRSIVTRKISPGMSLAGVHVLFIGRQPAARAASLVAAAKELPVLVVTDSDDVFAVGGAINFVLVDNKVRFDVSLRAHESSGVKISSRLLGVARRVQGATL
jgi:hypothetical protein